MNVQRNLVVRVATALVLLPLVLWLLWIGGLPFALLVAVAAAVCAWELNCLPDQRVRAEPGAARRRVRGHVIASTTAAFLLPITEGLEVHGFTARGIIAALVMVALADALLFEPELERVPGRVGLSVLGAAYPGILLAMVVRLRQLPDGVAWLMLTLVVTWLNDTGAYFSGRAYGRHKLYPRISPSKTWEGAAGGLAASVAGALFVKAIGWLPQLPWWGSVIVGAGAAVLGPVGDLSESMLKRAFGAKDSSALLPGHGGVLDRVDALLFTAPFVLFCASFLPDLR
ncbi:MAG TPA: phosphatidate cytidylyltransferase [Myxococcales bacterium]|jgi:phosphatidate cytidylyltransferase|nr:phosphatidate cytidylyltransferase [Myxococcales bacterium]